MRPSFAYLPYLRSFEPNFFLFVPLDIFGQFSLRLMTAFIWTGVRLCWESFVARMHLSFSMTPSLASIRLISATLTSPLTIPQTNYYHRHWNRVDYCCTNCLSLCSLSSRFLPPAASRTASLGRQAPRWRTEYCSYGVWVSTSPSWCNGPTSRVSPRSRDPSQAGSLDGTSTLWSCSHLFVL